MAQKLKRSTMVIIGGVSIIVIIGVALVLWFPSWLEDSRKEEFERGRYEHSFEALESSWHDIRIELVRTALIISSCESHNQLYCDSIERHRNQLLEWEMPEKLEEGDAGTYQRASDRNDWRVMLNSNTIDQNDYYIERIHGAGIDEDLAGMINTVVQESRSARSSLYLAELELISDPDNEEVLEAKEHLEAAYAEFETTDLPSGWNVDDVEAVLTELRDARSRLDELIIF